MALLGRFLLQCFLCLVGCFNYYYRPVSGQGRPVFACDVAGNPGLKQFRFCNPRLDVATRVTDLVSRLTLEEKIGWLVSGARGVARLGIPNYEWWSEALHGVSSTGPGTRFANPVPGATSFPQVILTAATFNESLFRTIGKVVSTEARAMYNVGLSGLTFWSPNVNIFRDPRWGRGQETPGEDPVLASTYAVAYVKGLQQPDQGRPDQLKVAACCKHYTAYDLDDWKGNNRFTFDAVVTQQDLYDTYQPPFKSCVVEGNVASVMCSYNQVNGKPTCGDPELLSSVVRGELRLNGYIVSDCDSLLEMFSHQHYTKTPEETAALAINSGLDLNCGSFLIDNAKAAVDRGLLNVTAVDRAVSNNLATMMRLGFFDGNPKDQPYGNLGPKDVCTKANQELAHEAARQGIVLLKNTKGSLPLVAKAIKSLAVIGPNANVTDTMIGNYAGTPCKYTTPLHGLGALVPTVFHPGCDDIHCKKVQVDDAKKVASEASVVVLVMGSNQAIEREALDRVDLMLPGQQQVLVSAVASVSKGPVILVIMSGGGMDVQFARDDPKVTSILWVGFPGQAGGAAIADVIVGHYNPSGRLPMTWYPQSYADNVLMTNMNMRPDPATGYPGRTYRFYTGPTVFPFGYGISYSAYNHYLVTAPKHVTIALEEGHACRSSLTPCKSISHQTCGSLGFQVWLRVVNVGKMSGSHTVLMFTSPPHLLRGTPQKKLLGFRKLHLAPGGKGDVRFNVDVCKELSVVDEEGKKKVVLGKHLLHIGSLTHSLEVRI